MPSLLVLLIHHWRFTNSTPYWAQQVSSVETNFNFREDPGDEVEYIIVHHCYSLSEEQAGKWFSWTLEGEGWGGQ